jgi:hypothetical protein
MIIYYPEQMSKDQLIKLYESERDDNRRLKRKQRAHINSIKKMQTKLEIMKLRLLWMQEMAGISLEDLLKEKEKI